MRFAYLNIILEAVIGTGLLRLPSTRLGPRGGLKKPSTRRPMFLIGDPPLLCTTQSRGTISSS